MEYDFTNAPNRRGTGAYKWDEMLKLQPYLPEDVIPFTIADMEFATAPEIAEGLCEYVRSNVLGYTAPNDAYFEALDRWISYFKFSFVVLIISFKPQSINYACFNTVNESIIANHQFMNRSPQLLQKTIACLRIVFQRAI